MSKWPGMGDRIRERMFRLGYQKDGRADITRFCLENRFLPSNVYRWVNSSVLPDRENLIRLAEYLQVSPAWILFGDEGGPPPPPGEKKRRRQPHPISGGSGEAPTPCVVQVVETFVAYRTLALRWARALLPPMLCPA